jgi:tetratricopeptide (TPR) repeat protein
MAYKPPNTASYHMQMAWSFYNDARKISEDQPSVGQMRSYMSHDNLDKIEISDTEIHNYSLERIAKSQMEPLRKAIDHLNQARALDPTAIVSYPSDNKEEAEQGIKLKATVDQMYAKVLSLEGIAHLNIANAIEAQHYKRSDGTVNRKYRNDGISHLEAARDAFIKALKYDRYHSDATHFLERVYYNLGDTENYRKFRTERCDELQRQIDSDPDNVELHKKMQTMLQDPGIARPIFQAGGSPFSVWGILTGMFLAGAVCLILGFITQGGTVGLGIFLIIVSGIGFWIREKLSLWFG